MNTHTMLLIIGMISVIIAAFGWYFEIIFAETVGIGMLTLTFLFGFFTAEPADAAVKSNGMTICIKEHVNGKLLSSTRNATRVLDSYTGSRMVRGNACKPYSFTVNIRSGRVPQVSGHGVRTYGYTSPSGHTITIDPHTPAYARTRLIEHELGHAIAGLKHSTACNIMKANLTCNGHLVPERFTNAQKATLRSH